MIECSVGIFHDDKSWNVTRDNEILACGLGACITIVSPVELGYALSETGLSAADLVTKVKASWAKLLKVLELDPATPMLANGRVAVSIIDGCSLFYHEFPLKATIIVESNGRRTEMTAVTASHASTILHNADSRNLVDVRVSL